MTSSVMCFPFHVLSITVLSSPLSSPLVLTTAPPSLLSAGAPERCEPPKVRRHDTKSLYYESDLHGHGADLRHILSLCQLQQYLPPGVCGGLSSKHKSRALPGIGIITSLIIVNWMEVGWHVCFVSFLIAITLVFTLCR